MKMKRYLALLTCAILTASLLTGCGGKQKPPAASSTPSSGSPTSSSAATSQPTTQPKPTPLP